MGIITLVWAVQSFDRAAEQRKGKANTDQIYLIHADRLYFNENINSRAQFLVGNVTFEHHGAKMYCDSALYYKEDKSFDAYGHVRMVQGDTLSMTGKVLHYDGITLVAHVGQDVVLKHRQTTLYTDTLDYFRKNPAMGREENVGVYNEGGKLIDQGNQLTSTIGYYYPDSRQSEFYYNVRLVKPLPPEKPEYTLESDTLFYNTKTTVSHVKGPSNLDHDDTHIYTENGYYTSNTDQAYLLNQSLVQQREKTLYGDSLHYDGKTHDSKAFGNITYRDSESKNMFTGDYGMYNDSTGYAEAADKAVCIDYSQNDTLYMHADTFKLFTYYIDTDSMYRLVHAYNHVKSYRVDMQAICDSMVFDSRDSIATLYLTNDQHPVVWQQNDQIFGEEIRVWLNDSTMDSVHVVGQAMMVEQLRERDSIHFNQVSGDMMYSYFRDGEMYQNQVDKNVRLNYYPFDSDSLMMGMVHISECAKMIMHMKDKKMEKIWMPATKGKMYPLDQIPQEDRHLKNFHWLAYLRPLGKDDVLVWREIHADARMTRKQGGSAPTSVRKVKQ